MAFELLGRIGIDATDLDRLPEKVRELEHALTGAFRRTGDIRAASALEGFINNLTSGNVIGAIESIAQRLTGLGLIGGVAFGSLVLGIREVVKATSEYDTLIKGVHDRLSVPVGAESGRAGLSERISQDLKDLADLQSKSGGFLRHLNPFAGIGDLQGVMQMLNLRRDIASATGLETAEMSQRLTIARAEAAHDEEGVARAKLRLEIDKQRLEIAAGLAKQLADPTVKGDVTIQNQLKAEAENALHILDKIEQIKGNAIGPGFEAERRLRERSGLSSDELLAAGQEAPNAGFTRRFRQSFPVALQGDAYMLGLAQRTEAFGERFRRAGFQAQAENLFSRADAIRGGITSLKESEKAPEYQFKTAIESANIFKQIKAAIDQATGAIKAISFKNQ